MDASFAVHKDMKSHTGAVMTLGQGAVIGMSTKQKLNTKSSTEAEMVWVDDALPLNIWSHYLEEIISSLPEDPKSNRTYNSLAKPKDTE